MIAAMLAACLWATAAPALDRPNHTGTWKMNAAQSDLGGRAIDELRITIEHTEPRLQYTTTGSANGESFEERMTVNIGGAATVDQHGATVKARWDGTTLIFEFHRDDGTLKGTARETLSADGKTLTLEMTKRRDDGELKQRFVLEKQ